MGKKYFFDFDRNPFSEPNLYRFAPAAPLALETVGCEGAVRTARSLRSRSLREPPGEGARSSVFSPPEFFSCAAEILRISVTLRVEDNRGTASRFSFSEEGRRLAARLRFHEIKIFKMFYDFHEATTSHER